MIYFVLFIFHFWNLQSQEVAKDEINNIPTVNFENRNRQRANQELIDKNIKDGQYLAEKIKESNQVETNEIILKTVPPSKGKLGADIFSFKSTFYYGHINVIKRILNSYIQKRFEYNEQEASLLTNFTLYYNAVHRKKYDYILERYSPDLSSFIDKDKVGISLSFSGWSNKSQIIIPILSNILKEENTDIPTEEIEKVEELPTLQEKEKIEKFKENKIKKEEKVAEEILEKVDNEINELKEIEKELIQEVQKKEKEETNKAKLIQDIQEKIKKNKEKIKKKEIKKEEIKEKKKEIQKKKESNPKNKKSNKDKNINKIDNKKNKELKKVKKELETLKKEKEKKENFDKNVVKNKIIYLNTIKYLDKGHYNNELKMIDTDKDDTILTSKFENICSKKFEIFQEDILVISFEKNHSKNHKLTLINQDSLLPLKSTDINIFWRSPIIIKKDKIFIFEMKGKKVYFSQLDKNLKKIHTTIEEINPNSNVTFFGKKIYLNGKNKDNQMDILVLNRENLRILKRMIQ